MHVRDPITELQETNLFRFLKLQDESTAERITQFVRGIAPVMATTAKHFPYYTRHDAHHGFRVVRRIEQIIFPDCLQATSDRALGPTEIFLLIAAAYAHDLGMTVFPNEKESLLHKLSLDDTSGWETSPILQSYLRKHHSKRGGDYVHLYANSLGVPANLVSMLDLMMRSHNLSIGELERELGFSFAAQEKEIDLMQLAVIVCVADAIEFSETRVMDGVIDLISLDESDAARISLRENMKHICIGDSLAIGEDGRIIISGAFSDHEVIALAHKTIDQIEQWIQGYVDIERGSRTKRLRIGSQPFLRNLDFRGGRFERLGIRLNKRSVIDLIASNSVWKSNHGIAIRELVQNAVEACRFRSYYSSQADQYQPSIHVKFDRHNNFISVSDNGCGMSERTVLNNFLTVGSSRSKESSYAASDYSPIARFGIGFWSVFTIAQRAHVETAAFEGYRGDPKRSANAEGISFDVELKEIKDYTVFSRVSRSCGTTVTLYLKSDIFIDDVYEAFRRQVVCSEIPVNIEFEEEVLSLPSGVTEVSDEEIFGDRIRVKDELNVHVFRWKGNQEDTELSIGFAYRMIDGRATFMADASYSLQNRLGHFRSGQTSICGFSVPVRIDPLCFDLLRIGTFKANHKTPNGFDFSLDRQGLLENAAANNFRHNIWMLIHQAYRCFLSETNSDDAESIFNLNSQSMMHGGNVYDTFTDMELVRAATYYPDIYSFSLMEVSSDRDFENANTRYETLASLKNMHGVVWSMQNHFYWKSSGGETNAFYSDSEHAIKLAYETIRRQITASPIAENFYVTPTNRNFSMLFDGDYDSFLHFTQFKNNQHLCLQGVLLGRIRYTGERQSVIASVQGRWTGTIYSRRLNSPYGRPYVFLGRHRVVIQAGSRLEKYIVNLENSKRLIKLADTIRLLAEDSEGYTSSMIAELIQADS